MVEYPFLKMVFTIYDVGVCVSRVLICVYISRPRTYADGQIPDSWAGGGVGPSVVSTHIPFAREQRKRQGARIANIDFSKDRQPYTRRRHVKR